MLEIIIRHGPVRSAEQTLSKVFGPIAQGSTNNAIPGKTVHLSCIPDLYVWSLAQPPLISKLREYFNRPVYWQVDALQGQGLTPEESIENLHDKVLTYAHFGEVGLLQRRGHQDEFPVIIGKDYKAIYREDKEHDHDDPRIANFIAVEFHPLCGFLKGSLDGPHRHLWIGDPAVR